MIEQLPGFDSKSFYPCARNAIDFVELMMTQIPEGFDGLRRRSVNNSLDEMVAAMVSATTKHRERAVVEQNCQFIDTVLFEMGSADFRNYLRARVYGAM